MNMKLTEAALEHMKSLPEDDRWNYIGEIIDRVRIGDDSDFEEDDDNPTTTH